MIRHVPKDCAAIGAKNGNSTAQLSSPAHPAHVAKRMYTSYQVQYVLILHLSPAASPEDGAAEATYCCIYFEVTLDIFERLV